MPVTQTAPVSRRFILGFIAFLWTGVLLVLGIVVGDWWAKHPGADWNAATGQVSSIDCRYRGKHTSTGTEWRYRYRVGEVLHSASYTSDSCDPQSLFVARVRHEDASVRVYYDPADPSRSVLERKPPFPWRHLFVLVMPLGVAIFFTWLGWKELRPSDAGA